MSATITPDGVLICRPFLRMAATWWASASTSWTGTPCACRCAARVPPIAPAPTTVYVLSVMTSYQIVVLAMGRFVRGPVEGKVHCAGGRATVDTQGFARDPFSLGTGQPDDGAGNVVGLPTASQGVARDRGSIILRHRIGAAVNRDEAWCDGVHTNAVLPELQRGGTRRHFQGRLGRGIGGCSGTGTQGSARGDIDDAGG